MNELWMELEPVLLNALVAALTIAVGFGVEWLRVKRKEIISELEGSKIAGVWDYQEAAEFGVKVAEQLGKKLLDEEKFSLAFGNALRHIVIDREEFDRELLKQAIEYAVYELKNK